MENYFKQFEKSLKEIKDIFIKKNLKLATAESCTGGLLGGVITSIPGSSAFFECSIVVYSNFQKINILGVDREILKNFGAVSAECAYEMAYKLKILAGVDLAVSVTGIAGPDGGTDEKPVGTVFSTIFFKENYKNLKFLFKGSRNEIRIKTIDAILNELIYFALKN